jgi:hypothetical protein
MPNEPENTESNADFQRRTSVTIGELRKQYGARFAPGYGDEDTLGQFLGRGGYNSLDEYLNQHHHSMTPKSSN